LTDLDPEQRRVDGVVRRRFAGVRAHVHGWPGGRHMWRVGIAGLGFVVVVAGAAMLVLPGPGWVVIFIGFAIWATEFAWADSLLVGVRRRLAAVMSWLRRQPRWLWLAVGAACLVLVGAAAWLALTI
jgi:uncharacterized protein (TIGR02611 family)